MSVRSPKLVNATFQKRMNRSMQIDTSDPRATAWNEHSTSGVRRSKVKVTGGWS